MRVMIAGGTGFLGSRLKRHLEASGHEVRILTRRKPASPDQIRWDGRSPAAAAGRQSAWSASQALTQARAEFQLMATSLVEYDSMLSM